VVTDEVARSGRYSLKWDFSKAEGKGSIYGRDRWLIVNVQVPPEAAKSLRGKRVKVGYWFRLGGGTAVPGMVLRQSGKGEYLDGIAYGGGIEDPTVWNRFEAEGRLRGDYESMDIHISCPVPGDPELARKAFFYIDDVTLSAIEEPPLAVSTPLDEYHVGEPIPWTIHAASPQEQLRVALSAGSRPIAERAGQAASGEMQGTFETRGLEPGIYTIRAVAGDAREGEKSARRRVIVSPDPFAW